MLTNIYEAIGREYATMSQQPLRSYIRCTYLVSLSIHRLISLYKQAACRFFAPEKCQVKELADKDSINDRSGQDSIRPGKQWRRSHLCYGIENAFRTMWDETPIKVCPS